MAFSMSFSEAGSKGRINSMRGSGTLIEASWIKGVLEP